MKHSITPQSKYRTFLGLTGWILLTIGILGCGQSTPRAVTDPGRRIETSDRATDWAIKYPDNQFITAWGYSDNSHHEAELNAKAQVSEQVSSRLHGETRAVASAWMKNNEIIDKQYLKSIVESSTSFERAELIKCITVPETNSKNQEYRVFAYLNRSLLAKELHGQYSDIAPVFRTNHDSTVASQDSPFAFTPAWHATRSSFKKMFKIVCQFRAVTGSNPPEWEQDRARFQEIERVRTELLGRIHIVVHLEKSPDFEVNSLKSGLVGALNLLGIQASTGSCDQAFGLTMNVSPTISWKEFMGARYCQLSLEGRIYTCESPNSPQPIRITGKVLEGSGTDPIHSLSKRLTPNNLAPLCKSALSIVLPIN